MMLVMTTTGVFDGCHSNLIDATWSKLDEFVPQLKAELYPAPPSSSSEHHQQLVHGDTEDDQQLSSAEDEIAASKQHKTGTCSV